MHYYVIDVESTGLKAGFHEISQISVIRCSDRNQLSLFITIENFKAVDPRALEATGRTIQDLIRSDSVDKKTAVDKLHNFITSDNMTDEHRCFIGHNCDFDKRFCHALWDKAGKKFPGACWLDTKPFAKQWAIQNGITPENLKLPTCIEFAGIKSAGVHHNAITDTRNTYALWKKAMDDGIDHLPFIKRKPHE